MRDQILKLAGVKTDKEFYKLFPSEEAFMKVHGKAFKKAQMGTAIEKAQFGNQFSQNYYNSNGPYFSNTYGDQSASSFNPGNTSIPSGINTPNAMGAANQMLTPTNPFALSNAGNTWAAGAQLPQGVTDTSVPSDIGYNAPQASGAFDIMPYAQAATSVFGGIKALGAQKKALKEARMWNKVTGLQARAAESVDVDANRPKNYVRPEDNPVQPGQLFPSYGVGTNVLKRNGGPIRAQDGTELDTNSDLINKYPNSARQKQAIEERKSTSQVYGPQEAPADYKPIKETKPVTNSRSKSKEVWQIWEEKTGTPWSEAKKKGYTDGSAKSNLALADKLLKGNKLTTPSGSKPSAKPATSKPQTYAEAMASKPKMSNRNVGNIQEPEEGNFITRTGEELANPLQSLAHYTKYGELPVEGFSKYNKNAYDQVIGMVNPMYWANALGNASDYAGEGEYKKAALESLDAAPALGKLKYVKNIPYLQGLPAARKYGPAAKQIGEGAKRIGKGTTKQLGPGKMKQIGRGTHPNFVMYEDGGEIQNTYAPNTLYDDLGYEPLNDSDNVKQYYHGGNIHQMQAGGFMNFMGEQGGAQALGMLSGAMNDNSGGSQIGSGLGTAAGTAFGGPVGGMIGGALGSMVGGALDKSASKMKKEQRGIQRNQDRIMGSQFAQGIQNQYGSYMEEGGQLTNPQLITRFGELDQQDFYDYAHEGMDSLRAGGHLREYTPISNRGMEQYAMGGEVKTTWGGHAETISRNPYMPGTGETIMFRGKSHDESDGNGNTGIGVKYGKGQHDSYTDYAEYGTQGVDADVEVERGEPAAELQDPNGEKNLTVYGNLKIPNQYLPLLNDPRAKGKKFKNYINEISKDEDRQTKLIDKSTTQLNDLDVRSSFDKLKFDALSSSIKGANMKLKDIADKKKNAAYLQNAINDTAEEHGLVADDLARGKIKYDKEALQEYAEYGTTIPKAQDGNTKPPTNDKEARERGFTWTGRYSADGKRKIYKAPKNQTAGSSKTKRKATALGAIPKGQGIDPKTGLSNKITPEQFEAFKQKHNWYDWTGFDPKNAEHVDKFAKEFNKKAKAIGSTAEILPDKGDKTTVIGIQYISPTIDQEEEKTPAKTEEDFVEIGEEKDKTYKTTDYKRSKLMDIANMILPFIRPTDQEPLSPRQLMGEMYALSTNQLEPVQAQGYQPDLATPYDISYQDQMNEITAQTRAAQKMAQGNPAAQAAIAAQAYDAINKVKGEEFRANQAMQTGVYNQNRATLNDAKLKNLDIYDRQYTRQADAKSNTKAIAKSALESISDKYTQNKAANRQLGVYENLYNFRYDPAGRAINMNPLFQPNMPTIYPKQDDPNMIPVYDASGKKILRYISTTPEETTQLVEEEEDTTPVDTTTDYTPIQTTTAEEEDIFAPLPMKNGGKKKKKITMNGSIVKMYKTI